MNREQWLEKATAKFRPEFEKAGFPLPEKIRVSCGFPSSKARARRNMAIGEHWSPKASCDQTHEIFISPVLNDELSVLATLVHELCHAATDGDGHKGRFPASAKALKLEGKPTATFGGDTFKQSFAPIFKTLGEYPHAKLNAMANLKKQGTRMLKAQCPACEYTVRLTAKWAEMGLPTCICGEELELA
jgi:hypothetical protein